MWAYAPAWSWLNVLILHRAPSCARLCSPPNRSSHQPHHYLCTFWFSRALAHMLENHKCTTCHGSCKLSKSKMYESGIRFNKSKCPEYVIMTSYRQWSSAAHGCVPGSFAQLLTEKFVFLFPKNLSSFISVFYSTKYFNKRLSFSIVTMRVRKKSSLWWNNHLSKVSPLWYGYQGAWTCRTELVLLYRAGATGLKQALQHSSSSHQTPVWFHCVCCIQHLQVLVPSLVTSIQAMRFRITP